MCARPAASKQARQPASKLNKPASRRTMNASVPATGGASTSTSPEAARSAAAATAAAGPLRLALAAAESVRSCSNSCLSRSFSACKADSCATSLGSVGPPPGRGDAVAAVEVAERPALPLLGVAEVEAVGCGCRGKMRQVAAGNAMRKAGRQGGWVGVAALHTACAPHTALDVHVHQHLLRTRGRRGAGLRPLRGAFSICPLQRRDDGSAIARGAPAETAVALPCGTAIPLAAAMRSCGVRRVCYQ
jgi:hypothetical protein